MRNTFKIILILILTLNFTDLKAGTLLDSLNSAYLNNPKLNAERANVRAINEEKEEALSEFRPKYLLPLIEGTDTRSEIILVTEPEKLLQRQASWANLIASSFGKQL